MATWGGSLRAALLLCLCIVTGDGLAAPGAPSPAVMSAIQSVDIEELCGTLQDSLLFELCDGVWDGSDVEGERPGRRPGVVGQVARLRAAMTSIQMADLEGMKAAVVEDIQAKRRRASTWLSYEKAVLIRVLQKVLQGIDQLGDRAKQLPERRAASLKSFEDAIKDYDAGLEQDLRVETRFVLIEDAQARFPTAMRFIRLARIPAFLLGRNATANTEEEHNRTVAAFTSVGGFEHLIDAHYWYADAQCWRRSGRLLSLYDARNAFRRAAPTMTFQPGREASDISLRLAEAIVAVHKRFKAASELCESKQGGRMPAAECRGDFGYLNGEDMDLNRDGYVELDELRIAWRAFDRGYPIAAYRAVRAEIESFVDRTRRYQEGTGPALTSIEVYDASEKRPGGRVRFEFSLNEYDVTVNAIADLNELIEKMREGKVSSTDPDVVLSDAEIRIQDEKAQNDAWSYRMLKRFKQQREDEWKKNQTKWALDLRESFLQVVTEDELRIVAP
ncbi:MAG TPA: hypothetical protein VF278_11810 [Pirellulales bacterium]